MSWWIARPALAAMIMAAAFPSDVGTAKAAPSAASDNPDPLHVSLLVMKSKQGATWPEAEIELHNTSDGPLFYAGYSADGPAYRRQCLGDDQWSDDDMGWCGNGMEAQTLEPGQKVRFRATLCSDADATKIGLAIDARKDETGIVLWSDAIRPPPYTSSGRIPEFSFDEVAASRKALEYLRTIGAVGNLGTSWKLEKPEVVAVQVSDAEATKCAHAGRYVIVQYKYVNLPSGGPNSIVFEAVSPISETWKRRGMLTAVSMDDAIAQFRDDSQCN